MGVLDGISIVEIAGIGPGPFCGMLLAGAAAPFMPFAPLRSAVPAASRRLA